MKFSTILNLSIKLVDKNMKSIDKIALRMKNHTELKNEELRNKLKNKS